MGIRYDKDAQRKHSGPTIYFTDATSLIMLGNALRSSLELGGCVYAYRRPGEMMVTFGSAGEAIEGIGVPGFVIAPFLPSLPYLTIPFKEPTVNYSAPGFSLPFPSQSTSEEQHRSEVEAIQEALEGNGGGKIIASRVIVSDGRIDVARTFIRLCAAHPSAFVFCFSTPATGCWIGASPELLLEGRRGILSTMALAGSRPSGSSSPWDEKNIEEQQMVADFIRSTLADHKIKVEEEDPFTLQAGRVEHICTRFSGEPENSFTSGSLSSLLHTLSPTPALCGLPRELALDVIKATEGDIRGCYGGFCGPYRSPSDFTLYAILRCARAGKSKYCLYAGGGITLKSIPEKEWEETEIKSSTVRDALQLS